MIRTASKIACLLLCFCCVCGCGCSSSGESTPYDDKVQTQAQEHQLIRDLNVLEVVPYAPGLTSSERSLITRVILKEVYGEPIMVQIGVAQLIRDSAETRGLSVSQAIETLKFGARGESELGNLRPQAVANAQDAVHKVFDLGVCLVPYRLSGMRVDGETADGDEDTQSLIQVDKYIFY